MFVAILGSFADKFHSMSFILQYRLLINGFPALQDRKQFQKKHTRNKLFPQYRWYKNQEMEQCVDLVLIIQ